MRKRGSVWWALGTCLLLWLALEVPFWATSGQQWVYAVADAWSQGTLQGTAFADGQIRLESRLELG